MTRMLTALAAMLALTAAVAQPAPAKPSPKGGGTSHGGPDSSGAVLEASATAQASGDGSTASATATCPSGTKVAGGGFDAPSSTDVVGLVYESVKIRQHAWRASVQLLDPGDPSALTLTSYAYCRAHFPATKATATTIPTNGEVQIGPTASASCPRGEVALAGGFRMPPPLIPPTVTDLLFDSLPSGVSGWDARVITGPAGPSSVTSEAYCSKAAGLPVQAEGASALNGVDSTESTATASCPSGFSPAAGGFAQPGSGGASFFFVHTSRRVGDSWQVQGLHAGTEPAVALHSAAYCA
jgi:hypothetical protein